MRRYWLILLGMALLSPLGLLAEGNAWGEWGADDLIKMLGFAPQGIGQAATWWQAILPEYGVRGLGERAGYVVSALVGSALAYLAALAYAKLIARSK